MSRVVIIDDHLGFRDRLESFVREQDGCSVAGLAGDALSGFRLVHAARPDVVLIDVNLADESGLQLATRLAGLDLGLRIVLMGENEATEYERAATLAGASAYVSKTEISRFLPTFLQSPGHAASWSAPAPAPLANRGGLIAQASAGGDSWGQAAIVVPAVPRFATLEAVLSATTLFGSIALNQPAGALAGVVGLAFLSYRQMTLPRFRSGHQGERVLRRTRVR